MREIDYRVTMECQWVLTYGSLYTIVGEDLVYWCIGMLVCPSYQHTNIPNMCLSKCLLTLRDVPVMMSLFALFV